MSEIFGERDPRDMPQHLFWKALRRDFDSATKANITKQNYCACPRYWYVDTTFRCIRCETEFYFTTTEQKHWYEDLNFYIGSLPKHCPECRRQLRQRRDCRNVYDRDIAAALQSDDVALKLRLIELIDELCETGDELPASIIENRRILAKQVGQAVPGDLNH